MPDRPQMRIRGIPPDRHTEGAQEKPYKVAHIIECVRAALDRAGNAEPVLISAPRNHVLSSTISRTELINSIQTTGIPRAHSAEHRAGERLIRENVTETGVFALFLVPLLTMPVFGGSLNVGDKPMVVAEGTDVRIGGVRVGVGERHRQRDHPGAGLYMGDRGYHHHHDRDDDDR
jgi:hypothetical protein